MDYHSDNPFAIPDKCLTSAPAVIYGQEVLYAARGQEARSRPAQAGIQWFIAYIPAQAGMTTWVIPASVTGAIGLISRPALLDAGLRRNDGGGRINALKGPKGGFALHLVSPGSPGWAYSKPPQRLQPDRRGNGRGLGEGLRGEDPVKGRAVPFRAVIAV